MHSLFIPDMFHSATQENNKGRILATFSANDSSIHVLLATKAFGFAIVVNWDLPSNIVQYQQEVIIIIDAN